MAKRTLKQDLIEWAKHVDADANWFYAIAPSSKARRALKDLLGGDCRIYRPREPLLMFSQKERTLLLLLVAAGMHA